MTLNIYFGEKIMHLASNADLSADALQHYTVNPTLEQIAQAVSNFLQSNDTIELNICRTDIYSLLGDVQKSFKLISAAGGLIENGNGELLVIYRRGMYDLPKGKRENNETNEENALREVAEETGLNAHIVAPLADTYHIYQLSDGQYCLKTTHWFRMKVDGTPTPTPQTEEDIAEAKWVSPEQLKTLAPKAHLSLRDIFLNA